MYTEGDCAVYNGNGMNTTQLSILFIVLILFVGVWYTQGGGVFSLPEGETLIVEEFKNNIADTRPPHDIFLTDGVEHSIPLDEILSGGPAKDGIPAIDEPQFVSIDEANVGDEVLGVLVEVDGEKRYYPYNILVWHEIVNDSIGDVHFAVTFCPLCSSAIVFNRELDGEMLSFGVSGLLWESNLLMYDRKTESLWSQARGEAVVGEYTGTGLSRMDMRLIEFGVLEEEHPSAQVLSRDTGFVRSYDIEPYSGYGLSDQLFFPVSVSDARFPTKEIMYVVPYEGVSYAFSDAELEGSAQLSLGDVELVAERESDGGITVTADGKLLPGYYEMWFSWATHHQEDGVVWKIE